MEQSFFTGPFASMCELYVSQKRATGSKYETGARRLRQFDDFAKKYNIQNYQITSDLVNDYCKQKSTENANSRRDRIYIMWTFAEFLAAQGYPCSCLPPDKPKPVAAHTPYIFSMEEMSDIFRQLDSMPATNFTTRHIMFPILFRILYGCGLRISEALMLKKEDIDIEKGIIYVQHGKGDKERIVVMSDSLCHKCAEFVKIAYGETDESVPFLYTKSFSKLSTSSVNYGFREILWDIGIPYYGKDVGPRVHELRHTFICHNIRKWAEAGIPIHSNLPVLAKYVGHSSINATQWYIRLTAESFPYIRQVCEQELGGIYDNIEFNKKECNEPD